MDEQLVLFDCDRIKEYVFATGRLKEIRGASQLVKDLTEEAGLKERFPALIGKARIIYADGGAGKIVFPSPEDAEAFRQCLEADYRRETVTGTVTTSCVSIGNGFSIAVRDGERELRRQKEARREWQQLAPGPYIRFCGSCGTYPAAARYGIGGADYLCLACLRKRQRADAMKEQQKAGRLHLADHPFGQVFLKGANRQWADACIVEDLGELGQISLPPNYIGFVYCDGNRMSEHLKAQGSEEAYSNLSHLVSEATWMATVTALRAAFPKPLCGPQGKLLAPFENVLMGGDDLILITAADGVIKTAITFCREFQRLTKEKGEEVSMSAGVVIAHAAQPILFLEQRARELLGRAKAFSIERKKSQGEIGAIDFLVVSTPGLEPVRQQRHRDYWIERDRLWRTRRPYALSEMERLLFHVQEFKRGGEEGSFPRRKLNALYASLFRPTKAQATFETMLIQLRLKERQRKKLMDFAYEFGFAQEMPWGQNAKGEYFTALTDLIELYDFIPAGEGGNDAQD